MVYSCKTIKKAVFFTDNPHKNHRERLKKRFINYGLNGFDPHNIIELLLFFGIPQGDVNPVAHELINKFGSLSGVFDASMEDLCSVKGIGEHSATLIKLIPCLFEAYSIEKFSKRTTVKKDSDEFYQTIVASSMLKSKECVWLYLFDNKNDLIESVMVHEGSVNSAKFEIRKLVEAAIKYNASTVTLVHNHPEGVAFPSNDDIQTTKIIGSVFNAMGVYLSEHYVVANNIIRGIINKDKMVRVPIYISSED